MRIFLSGATGFLGRKVALALAGSGHDVVAWVRDIDRAREVLGVGPELVAASDADAALADAMRGCDAVINLAGEPIAQRWTAAATERLTNSRVGLTRQLVAAMATLQRPPHVFISASAVGYYGERGRQSVTEASPAGEGFLAELCARWEDAARAAERLGTRVVRLRIGVVLGRDGGALPAMQRAAQFGLGAVLGSGNQAFAWIHAHDVVQLVLTALDDARYRGAVNATAPGSVTNAELTRSLASALGRPAWLRIPAFALRLLAGDAAAVVLEGAHTKPAVAQRLGFQFRFPDLPQALRDLTSDGGSVEIGPAGTPPDGEYCRKRRPRYLLQSETRVRAPLEEVFDFFERAENLGALTPSNMRFEIGTPTPIEMRQGTRIRYRIRLGPLPLPWLTEIPRWNPPHEFADAQLRGPYAAWFHQHRFERQGGWTRVIDRVWYSPPLGVLGALANRWFIAPMLRRIFTHRAEAMRWRFGGDASRTAMPAADLSGLLADLRN